MVTALFLALESMVRRTRFAQDGSVYIGPGKKLSTDIWRRRKVLVIELGPYAGNH